MPGPLAKYEQELISGALMPDPAQRHVAQALQKLFEALTTKPKKRWWSRSSAPSIRGIYLVGEVGRGKTHLMDLLAESLKAHDVPTLRSHFHGFMIDVQQSLKGLAGHADPLIQVADDITQSYRVLCFDECHVEDIGDAMILGELFNRLFERGVVLVTTSNQAPDDLYADGLQRARFLPAIEAIKTHCQVIRLEAQEDYRLRTLTQAPTYFYPITQAHIETLSDRFEALSGQQATADQLTVNGRVIPTLGQAGSVIWFDFATLCQTERSVRDYRAIFDQFSTVLLSGVPQMGHEDDNATKRFIHLIDEAYDRAIKLIILAEAAPLALYQGQRLTSSFERTGSRLIEMQSVDYLAKSSA